MLGVTAVVVVVVMTVKSDRKMRGGINVKSVPRGNKVVNVVCPDWNGGCVLLAKVGLVWLLDLVGLDQCCCCVPAIVMPGTHSHTRAVARVSGRKEGPTRKKNQARPCVLGCPHFVSHVLTSVSACGETGTGSVCCDAFWGCKRRSSTLRLGVSERWRGSPCLTCALRALRVSSLAWGGMLLTQIASVLILAGHVGIHYRPIWSLKGVLSPLDSRCSKYLISSMVKVTRGTGDSHTSSSSVTDSPRAALASRSAARVSSY